MVYLRLIKPLIKIKITSWKILQLVLEASTIKEPDAY